MPKEIPTYLMIEITTLSDRHVAALELFISKFKKGAAEHGDLMPGKVWTRDRLDEAVDKSFYEIFDLLELLGD